MKTKKKRMMKELGARSVRLWRMLAISILFLYTSLYKFNRRSALVNSLLLCNIDCDGDVTDNVVVPLANIESDRMLFGIFSCDSPKEADLRKANRETHLSYFKQYSNMNMNISEDTICSLSELVNNSTLARDATSCRIVYSFVMGGGSGDENLRKHAGTLHDGWDTVSNAKTRCLWEDPECGGKDITKWTLDTPKYNISSAFSTELKNHDDITLLSIPENLELGKTDTWFTYMAMLTRQHPELQIGFVGKTDSDEFFRWPVFFKYLGVDFPPKSNPFVYGGYIVHKAVCSGRAWGHVCADPNFIAERFATGAMAYLSTPLAQHVFMDGTTLQRKREVWMAREDMQLANMVYSDMNITEQNNSTRQIHIINHRYGNGGYHINVHPLKDPVLYRKEYYKLYPEQEEEEVNDKDLMNSTTQN